MYSARSIGSYIVTISANGRLITEVTGDLTAPFRIAGWPISMWMEIPEVLLSSKSVGSGGYANLVCLQVRRQPVAASRTARPRPGFDGVASRVATGTKSRTAPSFTGFPSTRKTTRIAAPRAAIKS